MCVGRQLSTLPFLCRHEENHFDHSYGPHDVPLGYFSIYMPLATCASSSIG
jgi:hypothetical protein